jgi:hypothetical protein
MAVGRNCRCFYSEKVKSFSKHPNKRVKYFVITILMSQYSKLLLSSSFINIFV